MAESSCKDTDVKEPVQSDDDCGSILHVVVVGFHHKRGCQVDFSYPPLIEGQPEDSHDVPSEWKHLPFLALPDGAHNFEDDTIYFHLPGRGECKSTIYGVSCYRQIKAQDLLSKTADVTRGTVQKCVCVLSKLPLYGLIQAKLELITHAYFCERDFSKTKILQEFYENLNNCIPRTIPEDSQVFLGLSLRDLVTTFKHKILVLFKLMMLERRILFYTSPVHKLCNTLLAIVSLFPGMIERGLEKSACPKHYNPRISTIELTDYGINTEEYLDVKMSHVPNYSHQKSTESSPEKSSDSGEKCLRIPLGNPNTNSNEDEGMGTHGSSKTEGRPSGGIPRTNPFDKENIPGGVIQRDGESRKTSRSSSQGSSGGGSKKKIAKDVSPEEELIDLIDQELYGDFFEGGTKRSSDGRDDLLSEERDKVGDSLEARKESNASEYTKEDSDVDLQTQDRLHQHSASIQSGDSGISSCQRSSTVSSGRSQGFEDGVGEMKMNRYSGVEDFVVLPNMPQQEPMDLDRFGFPLAIFGKGSLCHPYISLQQHDMLQDVNVRSFVIGATNALFKHHKHLMDVIVEVEEGKVTILDPELKKQVALSTADLRFADFLIKHVTDSSDVYLDGTGWEGSDEWIRAQFKLYLLSLVSTCTSIGTYTVTEIGDFNESFVQAWKTTHNFRMWNSKVHPGIDQIHTGHPFHGHLGVSDMKIRLSSVMQTTDRGKRLNSAINRTGVAVMQTGKVVGEALTTAKTAVSSWLYGLAGEWKEEGGEDETNAEVK
ncbi:late secretory pathway protein AVL9 homolog [Strongylocentrotus purpuratus]|uniref:UDENN domain-containing protein n=1 Tax=Strongylocentrotus purpuratus TaxID=7668 RepID=A0A7M7P4W5_STRPU|nr:late secretory pathway protein AVL9 homolog [Strongylocentrotus purpuratus]